MATSKADTAFDSLPVFDDKMFDPPEWAQGPQFQWKKNGESSKKPFDGIQESSNGEKHKEEKQRDESDEEEEDEEDTVWEDAIEDHEKTVDMGVDPVTLEFTNEEIRKLLDKATKLKIDGNTHFTAKPPRPSDAIAAYTSALEYLPPLPKAGATNTQKAKEKDSMPSSGIQEVTEEEAEAIQEEESKKAVRSPQEVERETLFDEVRECTKACYGNLAACHLALNEYKQAVKAATSALDIDPHYLKALQRRATANEKINSWSALNSAQEDYTLLLKILPPSSPHLPSIRSTLATLPSRIKAQQSKETEEMMSKLKDLGNSILGNFGLSTDMFKFDEQPGGGYGVRFER